MLSTAGLVGLVGFVVLMVGSLVVLWRMDPRYGLVAFVVILSRLVQGQLDLFWVAVQTSVPFLIVGICLGAHGRELADQPPGVGQAAERMPDDAAARQGDRVTDAPTLDIVHVCCTNAFAGVERHVSELAAAQVALGHRVTVVGGHQPRVRATAGDGVVVLPGHAIHVALRSLRRLPAASRRRQRAHDRGRGGPLDGPVAARRARGRAPATSPSPRGTRRLTRPVTRWGTRRIDGQIAVSQYVADHVDGASTVVLSGVRPEPDRVGGGRPAAGRPGRAAARAREATPTSRSAPSRRRVSPTRAGG